MRLRWTIVLVLSVAFFCFVLWFEPAGPSIEKMVPKGTVLVAAFSNPARTMETLDRTGMFSQIAEAYNLKLRPRQVQLAMAAYRLVIIAGRNPNTLRKFAVFAFDYGPTIRMFSLKERPGLYRAGELLCFSEKACAKKQGRYMLAGTRANLESYLDAVKQGLLDDETLVTNLKNFFARDEITLFVVSLKPVIDAFKAASDLDLSLLINTDSFAGIGIAAHIDETGLNAAGEIFSRDGRPVFRLDSTKKLALVEPAGAQVSLSFRLESIDLFEQLFANALNMKLNTGGMIGQLRKLIIESFVSTLSGEVAAALTSEESAWALNLARPDEMRSYLELVKRSLTGDLSPSGDRIEFTLPKGERTVIYEGDWLVVGTSDRAAKALMKLLKQADTGGPYALWASFWIPGIATDGPAMVYIKGKNARFIEGYVPKAMVPTLAPAPEIVRAKRYKLVARIIYALALALALWMAGLSIYKLVRYARPRQERQPSNRTA